MYPLTGLTPLGDESVGAEYDDVVAAGVAGGLLAVLNDGESDVIAVPPAESGSLKPPDAPEESPPDADVDAMPPAVAAAAAVGPAGRSGSEKVPVSPPAGEADLGGVDESEYVVGAWGAAAGPVAAIPGDAAAGFWPNR